MSEITAAKAQAVRETFKLIHALHEKRVHNAQNPNEDRVLDGSPTGMARHEGYEAGFAAANKLISEITLDSLTFDQVCSLINPAGADDDE